jgi:hypothetical protein
MPVALVNGAYQPASVRSLCWFDSYVPIVDRGKSEDLTLTAMIWKAEAVGHEAS